METLPFLIALILIESAALALTAWRKSPSYLREITVVQMVLIALFAPKLFAVHSFQSNIASVFYAAVFTAQAIVARRWSLQSASDNVWTVLGAMLLFYILLGVLGSMPSANDHDAAFTRSIYEILSVSPINAMASMVAFAASQFLMLATMDRYRLWWGVPIAILIGQALDSMIFYPVVFAKLPFEVMAQIAIDGFITKIGCAIALIPAYLYAVRQFPDDLTVRIDRLHEKAAERREGRYSNRERRIY